MLEINGTSDPTLPLSVPAGPLENEIARADALKRLDGFLRNPEARTEGLWTHQTEAVLDFGKHAAAILRGEQPNEGMSPLHATGTGKTRTESEIASIICQPLTGFYYQHRALWCVPNRRIRDQVLFSDGPGTPSPVTLDAPGMTVDKHLPGRRKNIPIVTVMGYQALGAAIERGDIQAIDPSIIIADENHHIIDGTWAREILSISAGRLLVGASASEGYSRSRTIRTVFPISLGGKQEIRKSIDEGILCEFRGYLHRGKSRIIIRRPGSKNFSPEDLFDAVANSEDNYTAAKICAGEVSQGRQGIVRCVPGGNRLHPKIMASILNKTDVEVNGVKRQIRAEVIDGSMRPQDIEDILSRYKAGEVDILTFVAAIGEGWNSPETELTVDMDPTTSVVKVQQPMGRGVRHYADGTKDKVATYHQFVYEVVGRLRQVLFTDIFEEDFLQQGRAYTPRNPGYMPSRGHSSYDEAHFLRVSGLGDELSEFDNRPISEIRIASGQEKVPSSWPSSHRLSIIFDMPASEVRDQLDAMNTLSKQVSDEVYYPPASVYRLASVLGLEPPAEGEMTEAELVNYYHEHKRRPTRINRKTIAETMPVEATRRFTGGRVVKTYPSVHKDVPLETVLSHRVTINGSFGGATDVGVTDFNHTYSIGDGRKPTYSPAE